MSLKPTEKSVLYIAYHYPPLLGSSGVHRSLAFSRHLSENDWDTRVLTSSLAGYDNWSEQQIDLIPQQIEVIRAYGRNAAKTFSFRGKYLSWLALPDNWQSWIIGGVISGLNTIKQRRPSIIVSTYPIASAHIIAYLLHRMTGIPWVADFRDPMAQQGYPSDLRKRRIFQWIESKVVAHCSHVILTAPGALALYRERFPQVDSDFWQLINNGYDKVIFEQLAKKSTVESTAQVQRDLCRPFILLHSGIIYPSERDPCQFFAAISELKQTKLLDAKMIQIRLRATGNDDIYRPMLEQLDIADIVTLEPAIPYREALQEMFSVDGLLLLQAANCDYQIPAKAYEYIRVKKPILGLMPRDGDTGMLLQQVGISSIAPLDNQEQIAQALLSFVSRLVNGDFEELTDESIEQYSRQHQAARFERILDRVINENCLVE